MHDLPLLVNFTVALALSLFGGLAARRIGLPSIVGYLLAGLAISPLTPGWTGDANAISQMGELGVILLMFSIGLHFSVEDLWRVRDIAIPGALLQMVIVTFLGAELAKAAGFAPAGAWVFGFAASVSSTMVSLRSLMDHALLDSPHGKVAIGWLVFEDLMTVAILVLLPTLVGRADGPWWLPWWAVVKAGLFVGLMLLVGHRVVPILLDKVVKTRSRELFVLVALTLAAGSALTASALFGVSVALGAFVVGVVVSESEFSHQISADLLPFRETFAVLFFVSVGMLVNPGYILTHWPQVLAVSFLVVVVKGAVAAGIGFLWPYPARTALVLGASRGQIAEFSFIVGQAGLGLSLITTEQYSLILAGAIVSIALNPLMFRLITPAERWLRRSPAVWRILDRHGPAQPQKVEPLTAHVVVVGSGRVGRHISEVLTQLRVPRLVVEVDPARLAILHRLGVPALFGDAANSEILDHANLGQARALIVTLPDDAAAAAVVAAARSRAPELRVIARASTWTGANRLRAVGANHVVRPELEGGIEIVRRTLLDLELPVDDVARYVDLIRQEELAEADQLSAAREQLLQSVKTAGVSREPESGNP